MPIIAWAKRFRASHPLFVDFYGPVFLSTIVGLIAFFYSNITECASVRNFDMIARGHLANEIARYARDYTNAVSHSNDKEHLVESWKLLRRPSERPGLISYGENANRPFGDLAEALNFNVYRWGTGHNESLRQTLELAKEVISLDSKISSAADPTPDQILAFRKDADDINKKYALLDRDHDVIYHASPKEVVICSGPWIDYKKIPSLKDRQTAVSN